MINYPNLKKVNPSKTNKIAPKNYQKANLGLSLEADIKETNLYYLTNDVAVIYKKPTPIQIVRVNYTKSKARITDAFFKEASTTDYNGIFEGYYIDFDVKETKSKTSFPLSNIAPHQIKHLKNIYNHFGISFLIINFKEYNEYYLCPYNRLVNYLDKKRKSIPYLEFKKAFFLIPYQYKPRIDYLRIIKENLNLIIKNN